jgi:hypothetical protein
MTSYESDSAGWLNSRQTQQQQRDHGGVYTLYYLIHTNSRERIVHKTLKNRDRRESRKLVVYRLLLLCIISCDCIRYHFVDANNHDAAAVLLRSFFFFFFVQTQITNVFFLFFILLLLVGIDRNPPTIFCNQIYQKIKKMII